MITTNVLVLLGGLALLTAGAEALVRGASSLARRSGVSPLVIGLTIVAAGTSAPELVTSVYAAIGGHPDVGIGNVVGSNTFNILFILGLVALVQPPVVAQRLVWLDVPLMIGTSAAVVAMAYDGHLGRVDGALLLAGFAIYVVISLRTSRGEPDAVREEYDHAYGSAARVGSVVVDAALVAVGIAALAFGARLLVQAAVELARAAGLSEMVLGLTIVAAGTSVPEVATSVMAAVRKERDIAVGNIVGSNLLNMFLVLGLVGTISSAGVPIAAALLRFDMPVMLAAAVACLPIFVTGHRIDRWEGGLLVVYYVAYLLFTLLAAAHHDALPALSAVMLAFVVPLTAITLGIVWSRELRTTPRASRGS